ncbi:TetR/AcrR family transcriptional regulator [Tepidamorphus sp. 3E244]|uniref:TetR/AcrR family transcriptional regulator n=1 Tax=Tepidamorphus sp. 3E244 TaxID=3385498 RepID=UPI0038FC0C47
MGRTRTIDRDAVLDAAQRVVTRDGAARLTLDAVATEAGISKASVLYDYKTKHELIRAVIARRVCEEESVFRAMREKIGDGPDCAIQARVSTVAAGVADEDRAVAISLCAALAQEADLRQPIRESYSARIDEIRRTATSPRGALLAFLAAEGLKTLDYFDLHTWTKDERRRLISDIEWLIGQDPQTDPD